MRANLLLLTLLSFSTAGTAQSADHEDASLTRRLPENTVVRYWGKSETAEIAERAAPDELPTTFIVKPEVLRLLPDGVHALHAIEALDDERISPARTTLRLEIDPQNIQYAVTLLPAMKGEVLISVQPYISFRPRIGRAWTTDREVWVLEDGKLKQQSWSTNWSAAIL